MAELNTAARLGDLRLDPKEKRPGTARRQVVLVALLLCCLIAGVVIAAVMVSRSASQPSAERAAATSNATERQNAATNSPAPRRSEGQIAAGGYVEARRSARLNPGRDGVVGEVHVALGQQVVAGTLLVELENETDEAEVAMAEAEVAAAEARLRAVRAGSRLEEVQAADSETEAAEARSQEAQEELARLERLVPQGAIAAAEVDRARQRARAAEAQLRASQARERMLRRGSLPTAVAAARAQQERAEAALRRARARLELSRLRAPFDGVVVTLDVEPGEVISLQSGQSVMELADLDELWVRVDIPEVHIGRVELGDQAEVVVDALGDVRLQGEVVEIAPLADRQSNTVSVALRVLEPPPLLRPNMSARVFIEEGDDS